MALCKIGSQDLKSLCRHKTCVCLLVSSSPSPLVCLPEAQQRLLLVTVFALSVRYQPVDVSLAVSSGLLAVLSRLCGAETMLGRPLQLQPGAAPLSAALKVAATRLLQILAISTG